jgi:hypothetical protein
VRFFNSVCKLHSVRSLLYCYLSSLYHCLCHHLRYFNYRLCGRFGVGLWLRRNASSIRIHHLIPFDSTRPNMNINDARIPNGYPHIFREFMLISNRLGLVLNPDGSIPVPALMSYIDYQIARVMRGDIYINTLHYYLSALKSVHNANGILWTAREDPRILFVLKRLLVTPGLPSQEGTQDHPISLAELDSFCRSLDINNLVDIVAGALSTSLFFGLGRTPELLHARQHPPMNRSALRRKPSPLSGDCTYSYALSYPKIRTVATQFISPILSYGITSANFWIARLKRFSHYENIWQIDDTGTVPTSRWLFDKISPFISSACGQTMGPCSFRAGGTSYLASSGYSLSHIQLLGRWETLKAFNRYLRNHPHILQLSFQASHQA